MKLRIAISCLLLSLTLCNVDYANQGTWTGSCNTNPTRQSPIDIPCADFINACPSVPTYQTYWNDPTSIFGASTYQDLKTFFNNQNHWVQFTNASGSYLFKSAQFHLHQPSEHTINGKQYPIEMHIVHTLANSPITEYLVIGFMFDVDSTLTYDIFDNTPIDSSSSFSHLFPFPVTNKPAYHYLGSLTTPPCTEAVNWFVQTEVTMITTATKNRLVAAIGGGSANNRNIQNLNGRTVYLVGQGC